jgi:hypothetical protein
MSFRERIAQLGPYPALAIVVLPLAIVEPLKLVALVVAGEGHWLTGTIVLIAAYAVSLFIVERLFRMLRPQIMRLPWFAAGWLWFTSLRERAWRVLRGTR